jgi:aminoglycoside/choline kinase family phosphotransferase
MESEDRRKNLLVDWLKTDVGLSDITLQPMQGDASTRRYYRVHLPNQQTLVAMDAPPPQENTGPFVAIAATLREQGLYAPEIVAEHASHGFLLLSDFGDLTYLKALNEKNADDLYESALTALSILQRGREVTGRTIPPFTPEFMLQEWAWHKEWFLQKLLGLELGNIEIKLDQCYAQLVDMAASQPQVFMHRDFHSGNLMVLNDGSVGILDFQDAFIGPLTYDLASLLRDCYIDWPEERVQQWALDYLHKLQLAGELKGVSEQTFLRWFDWMSIQRHLKALLTFARKQVRDHQPAYLAHVPRTLNYIITVSRRYPELTLLHDSYRTIVQPAFERVVSTCAP